MDFITLRKVPLSHTVDALLQRFAKARKLKPEEAAGVAIQSYLLDEGERQARIAEAAEALERHRREAHD